MLAVAGLPCAGKSLFASHVAARGARWMQTRSHLRDGEIDWIGLLRRSDARSTRMSGAVDVAVLDAIRTPGQLARCRELFADVELVCVHCAERERRWRWDARAGRREEPETFEERAEREAAMGLGELYLHADRVLDTTGLSHPEFRARADEVVSLWLLRAVEHVEPRTRWSSAGRRVAFPLYGIEADGYS